MEGSIGNPHNPPFSVHRWTVPLNPDPTVVDTRRLGNQFDEHDGRNEPAVAQRPSGSDLGPGHGVVLIKGENLFDQLHSAPVGQQGLDVDSVRVHCKKELKKPPALLSICFRSQKAKIAQPLPPVKKRGGSGRNHRGRQMMETLLTELKEKIVEALDLVDVRPEEIDPDARLIGGDLGIDSIDVLEMVMMVEKDYGVRIDNRELGVKVFASVRALAQHIQENASGEGG